MVDLGESILPCPPGTDKEMWRVCSCAHFASIDARNMLEVYFLQRGINPLVAYMAEMCRIIVTQYNRCYCIFDVSKCDIEYAPGVLDGAKTLNLIGGVK